MPSQPRRDLPCFNFQYQSSLSSGLWVPICDCASILRPKIGRRVPSPPLGRFNLPDFEFKTSVPVCDCASTLRPNTGRRIPSPSLPGPFLGRFKLSAVQIPGVSGLQTTRFSGFQSFRFSGSNPSDFHALRVLQVLEDALWASFSVLSVLSVLSLLSGTFSAFSALCFQCFQCFQEAVLLESRISSTLRLCRS